MSAYYPHDDFDAVVNYVKELQFRTSTNKCHDNTKSVDTFVLKEDIFCNINEFIKDCVDEYSDKIFITDQKLHITQSWVNKTQLGQEHHYHYHPNSILSGVFFLQSDGNDVAPIKFVNSRTDAFHLEFKKNISNPFNEYTNSSYQFPSQARVLVLFPSYIPHSVPMNTGIDRYSLSFNTFPTGSFGSEVGLTYVSPEKT